MDIRQLKRIMKEFENSKIQKLEITEKDFTVKMEKESKKSGQEISKQNLVIKSDEPNQVLDTSQQEQKTNYLQVKAPLVGTYYNAPSPDSKPFVTVNQTVRKGDVLFIIEAMKVMNEITAPESGIVKKIHMENATMVGFGDVVLEIEA